jgi:hypothetical protein
MLPLLEMIILHPNHIANNAGNAKVDREMDGPLAQQAE